jgi:phosphohistidine phosphatase
MSPPRLSRSVPPQPDDAPVEMPSYELYLVRHAIAAERGDDWPDDTKRPLTTRGVNRFKDSLPGLKALDVAIDEIFSSPLVRAKQTADLLSGGTAGNPPVKLLDALAPGQAPAGVMGQLAAHLIGASRPLPFKKGGMCRIDVGGLSPKTAGSLVWFVTPKMLRKLAE